MKIETRSNGKTTVEACIESAFECQGRKGWSDADARALVGMHAQLHISIYRTSDAELDNPTKLAEAIAAAQSRIDAFEDGAQFVHDHLYHLWSKEKWKVDNAIAPMPLSWRRAFVFEGLLNDYVAIRASQGKSIERATPTFEDDLAEHAPKEVGWSDLSAALASIGKERSWFAEGAIEGDPLVLFVGPEKRHKSWALMDLAVATVLGTKWLGRFQIKRPGPVVYLDGEYGPEEFARRIARIARGMGRDPSKVIPQIKHLYSPGLVLGRKVERFETLLQAVRDINPAATMVDPLRNHLQGSENDADTILCAFEALAALRDEGKCPTFAAHHVNKSGNYSGHRAMMGRADLIFEGTDAEQTWYSTIGRKIRRGDPVNVPFTVNVAHTDDDDDSIATTVLSCRFESETHATTNVSKSALRVRRVLTDAAKPMSVHAICIALSMSHTTATGALSELRDAGLADATNHKWSLSVEAFGASLLPPMEPTS